jgi:hypothetical protein
LFLFFLTLLGRRTIMYSPGTGSYPTSAVRTPKYCQAPRSLWVNC